MMLSSTLDHIMIILTHIMAFPADRPGMPLFVLFLLFSVSLECQITQHARGNIGLGHHQVFICWGCMAKSGGLLNADWRWTKRLLCGWIFFYIAVFCVSNTLLFLFRAQLGKSFCSAKLSQPYRNGFNCRTRSLQEQLPHRNNISHPRLDLLNCRFVSVCLVQMQFIACFSFFEGSSFVLLSWFWFICLNPKFLSPWI